MSLSERILWGALALACTAACGGGAADPYFAPGSNTMAVSRSGASAFIADTDNGAVVNIGLQSGVISQTVVGGEPTRIARVGDRLFVTLRTERSIAVLDVNAEGVAELVDVVAVGAEPYGIVASPDGAYLYVALSTEGVVVEARVEGLEVTRRWPVEGEPRWLAITPNGKQLYVGSAMGGGLFRIDLGGAGEPVRVRLPRMERGVIEDDRVVELTPRVTGDPTIDPESGLLAIPGLYVDTTTSAGSPDPLAEGGSTLGDEPVNNGGGYAGSPTEGMTRFNPAIVVFPLGATGVALEDRGTAMLVTGSGALHGGVTEPVLPASDGGRGGEMNEVAMDTGGFHGSNDAKLLTRVRGYITSLVFHPSGHSIAATIEGARSVALVSALPVDSGEPVDADSRDDAFADGAFEPAPRVFVGTDDGPRGVVFVNGQKAVTWSAFGRSVSTFNAETAERGLELQALGEFFGNVTWSAGIDSHLQPSILPPEVQEGRRLFYSAEDASMASAGAGVSCATCHFEGRNDGLTWTFDHGVRQTPSLAGKVSLTSPVTWTNAVADVAREAEITSQGRMGGEAIAHGSLSDIASYIDWSRDVDVPLRGSTDPALARGQAIFGREDVGCATCHDGARYTDNKAHTMFGLGEVNTPGLVGVAATAPYLHDGSAATMRDLLVGADVGGMGHTAQLSEAELADLEAYVMSL